MRPYFLSAWQNFVSNYNLKPNLGLWNKFRLMEAITLAMLGSLTYY
ncbi:hypothetical protein SAMN06265220_11039 [Flavobacterium nitrogenifigens]|uniref:Uncharacterized protein n=1 Tax=Flavobacterium nitrogenifigens TaxID=1617283 RepID=A0A521FEQ4_9FLAO|nr:hypothetical protein SAMN06265220_11039 [Flavobacterium nitrogenifigens]